VKAFNHMGYHDLDEGARAVGDPARKAIALSGDDVEANDIVADLIDSLGFDPVDLGSLAEGAVLQPGRELFGANLSAAEIRDVVEQAAA
jgi:predicted dinucleotide-binding enzyme